ncbi:hypothetical protein L210DRAFT_934661 [Boletus edulis BED1]|uniref:Uncharacterized protein n=1 Tax=Boletus edulis BED1 TaxID=1328754 RepID=A0AAD4BQC1_BOLED|nr:hypothetical protein L210DRAFT_934661 [Boletus edulis BED1]
MILFSTICCQWHLAIVIVVIRCFQKARSNCSGSTNEQPSCTISGICKQAEELTTRLSDTLSQSNSTPMPPLILGGGSPAHELTQQESQDTIDAEQECATVPLSQPNYTNIYSTDLNAADTLDDKETWEKEVLDEFSHEFNDADDLEGIDSFGSTGELANKEAALPLPPAAGLGVGTHAMLPMWLASEYGHLHKHLTVEMKKNVPGLPKCYQNNTFYDGVDNPYLAVRSTFQLSSSLFHQPRFFIWFLHLLADRIPCPACHDAGRQPTKSFWNLSILNMLPPPLRDQFKFWLTHRSGLTLQLTSFLCEVFIADVRPEQFTTIIQAAHYQRYDLLHCQFLEMVLHQIGSGTLFSIWTTTTPFGAFGDRNGYAGFVPTARYFAKFYDMLVEEFAPAMYQLISLLPADVIKQNHSFKIC